jgi:hypothetical protein
MSSVETDKRFEYQGRLPKSNPLDAVYVVDGATRMGVEVKNIREWIYPMNCEAWVTIRKCLVLDFVPFLVARKMAYLTREVFRRLGILAFEFHRQVFAPSVAEDLVDIQHIDRLGYKDVITLPMAPYEPLSAFIQKVPPSLPGLRTRWDAHRPLLEEFAIRRRLGYRKTTNARREQHRKEFLNEVLREAQPTYLPAPTA